MPTAQTQIENHRYTYICLYQVLVLEYKDRMWRIYSEFPFFSLQFTKYSEVIVLSSYQNLEKKKRKTLNQESRIKFQSCLNMYQGNILFNFFNIYLIFYRNKIISTLQPLKLLQDSKGQHVVFVVQSLSCVRLFATPWTANSPRVCSNSCPLNR